MYTLAEKFVRLGLADAAVLDRDPAKEKLVDSYQQSVAYFAPRADDDLAVERRERARQITESKRKAREQFAAQHAPDNKPIEYLDREAWKAKAKLLGDKILAEQPKLRHRAFRIEVERALRAAGYALKMDDAVAA